ncbi:MAG: zinc ribbon domain-containing protein [Clostridia bacterium]|nr:zinc ribbon domain-containing protein [Clostridia bacterium]
MAVFEDVLSRAKAVAKTAGRKTEELVELTKIHVQIGDLRREIASLYEGLGRLVYDSRRSEESVDELIDACIEELTEQEAALARLEDRVMQNKNAVRCAECGAVNANNATFCNQCGKKLG